ncbi:Fungalysin metallopeptidase-domain-containing protein [Mycena olivaceomarginata]|nr:Fungalysin metallopeptidase-domain-containing protein [Mycena olivaceomarginata]
MVYLDQNTTDTTPQSSPGIFNYTQDPTLSPGAGMNSDAARTNVFYIINTVHDVWYEYGFTEAAFNFQQTNVTPAGLAATVFWLLFRIPKASITPISQPHRST